jgi:hypothetical protein
LVAVKLLGRGRARRGGAGGTVSANSVGGQASQ